MDSPNVLRQLLRAPAMYRTALLPPVRPHARTFALLAPPLPHMRYMSVPRIIQPSFWASMVPRFKSRSESAKPKEWNPATPYIILALLVGSQAIQILWLKQERGHNLRKAEAKIGILREVIERVQSGEDVPVEKVLGTGDTEHEKEWAEVLKDIQDEEALFQSKQRRRALRQAAAAQESEADPPTDNTKGPKDEQPRDGRVESVGGVKFY